MRPITSCPECRWCASLGKRVFGLDKVRRNTAGKRSFAGFREQDRLDIGLAYDACDGPTVRIGIGRTWFLLTFHGPKRTMWSSGGPTRPVSCSNGHTDS